MGGVIIRPPREPILGADISVGINLFSAGFGRRVDVGCGGLGGGVRPTFRDAVKNRAILRRLAGVAFWGWRVDLLHVAFVLFVAVDRWRGSPFAV